MIKIYLVLCRNSKSDPWIVSLILPVLFSSRGGIIFSPRALLSVNVFSLLFLTLSISPISIWTGSRTEMQQQITSLNLIECYVVKDNLFNEIQCLQNHRSPFDPVHKHSTN